jgi:hypothetical protein
MAFDARRWRFTHSMIEDAPDWKGVYVLWSGAKPLVIGRAHSIRAQLRKHHAHGMPQVTHYSWEICRDPTEREAQLAAELDKCSARASS